MKNKLVIYGNGNMAKTIYEFVKDSYEVVFFTVDKEFIADLYFCGIPVVPFEKIEASCPPRSCQLLIAVGFLQMNTLRQKKYEEGKLKGYNFATYIHPSIVRHSSVTFGENNIILDYVSIHPFTKIGNNNFISSNTNIGHDCQIENSCWINAGVSVAGETIIRNNCFLGVNSSIGHRLVIAEKCFIGANTLIAQDTEQEGVYLSPAGEKFRLKSESFLKFTQLV